MLIQQYVQEKSYFFDYHILQLLYLLALIAGVTCCAMPTPFTYLLFGALLTTAYGITKNKLIIACSVIIFVLGYARLAYLHNQYQCTIDQISSQHSVCYGTVLSVEEAEHPKYSYNIVINVDKHGNEQHPYHHPWYLQCYSKTKPSAVIGDYIQLAHLHLAPCNKGPFKEFLFKAGIHATTFLSTTAITVLHHDDWNVERYLDQIKYRILKAMRRKTSPLAITLISSIFFGNRLFVKQQYSSMKDLFCCWGIVHFLARSGIHLIIFILFLQLLLQLLPITYNSKELITIVLSIIYASLSWNSISFSRALFSFLWYKAAKLLNLQISILHTITMLSALFILYNPAVLFSLDFQLSFGITYALATINQYLSC